MQLICLRILVGCIVFSRAFATGFGQICMGLSIGFRLPFCSSFSSKMALQIGAGLSLKVLLLGALMALAPLWLRQLLGGFQPPGPKAQPSEARFVASLLIFIKGLSEV